MFGIPNPFEYLAGKAVGELAADVWTSIMLGIWSAGLWFLRTVLGFVDAILTPDVTAAGPAGQVYRTTFWLALALVLILAMAQLGLAAWRRDGADLAQAAVGVAQFVVVFAGWIGYCVMILAAAQGLTRSLMRAMFGVELFAHWEPSEVFVIAGEDITDTLLATVLGFMGLVLWLAAIGFLLVMLTRAGALLVLVATGPIAAAGLASGFSRSWFWKSFRWFHAAAFTPVLVALVLGLGTSLTTGIIEGEADGPAKTIGTAIPGVFLICIAAFSPLALFKLLAFVDPGTSSGAAMRAGYEAQGGLRGLAGRATRTSNAASSVDSHGRSASEVSQEGQANQRAAQATSSLASKGGSAIGPVAGGIGAAVGVGVGLMVSAGTRGAAVGADVANQMGAGHNTYVPDFQPTRRTGDRHRLTHPEQRGEDTGASSGGNGETGGAAVQAPPPAQTSPSTGAGPVAPSTGGGAASGAAGTGAAGAAAAGAGK
ncbi:type IV secretion system protein [Ornithinimicrobium avium]|uniref:type IV secretion system protein n=1 Tax=Ornithinimicrobium avium TaxID=2283195 RepID=UPI0013B3D6AA|nr:type IV secretion system protein [Ornithinimicrobium avium]